jgi:hypothetical protein
LGCAIVRRVVGGPRSPAGARFLGAVEDYARPGGRLPRVRLIEDLIAPRLPGLMTNPWLLTAAGQREFGADADWVVAFAGHAAAPSAARKALPNVLIVHALTRAREEARRETAAEVEAIRRGLLAGAGRPEPGPVRRLLGWFLGADDPPPGPFADAILARLPEPRRSVFRSARAASHGRAAVQLASHTLELCRWQERAAEREAALCDVVREVFANPFRRPVVHPNWVLANYGAARQIGELVLRTGGFGGLPILADALEDAGCTDEAVLDHLRSGGPHVPGCWALDAVLGRG